MGEEHTRTEEGQREARTTLGAWAELERQLLGFQPLTSKLRPPTPGVRPIDRRVLVASLLDSVEPLVLVSAPAGSGKTISLRQWAAADPRPTAWLSCDDGDNDPRVFLTYMVLALQSVMQLDPLILDLLKLSDPPIQEQVLPLLGASLRDAPPFLLILDDAHLVTARDCWRLVAFVLDQLPQNAQLAIGTRTRPSLPLPRLRADARLHEAGLSDLAFRRDEAEDLARLIDLDPGADELAAVLGRTEGWATGVYLALLAARDLPADEWPERIRGSRREIAEYLTDEVLDAQSPTMRGFLKQLSILESFNAHICAAVTGRKDSAALVERLARENLFVASLDDQAGWYRFHHLFAELLLDRLQRDAPDEMPDLHRRAAVWYGEHGLVEEAAHHWIAYGEPGSAADMVADACDTYADHGRIESARLLLDRFAQDDILSIPALTLAAGEVFGLLPGDPRRERLIRAACECAVSDAGGPDGTRFQRSMQLFLRGLHAPYGISVMLADAESGAALETGAPTNTWAVAHLNLGIARYLAGRRSAEQPLLEVASEPSEPSAQVHALAYLSLLGDDQDKPGDAADFLRRADEAADTLPSMWCPCLYLPLHLARARATLRSSNGDVAAQVARVNEAIAAMALQDDWILLHGHLSLGEIHLALGDVAAATTCAAQASTVFHRYPDAGILGPRLRRLQRALDERALTEPLTAAELRVLQLMPTNLTMQQLADRLFLSLNTVRSHARSIYRKLAVHDRTAAVERARELGLL